MLEKTRIKTGDGDVASGCCCFAGAIALAGLVDLTKFAFAFAHNGKKLLGQFDGFLLGIGLKDREPADQLFGFRERTIGHRKLSS